MEAVNKLPNKSPQVSQILSFLIKDCSSVLKTPLFHLFNSILIPYHLIFVEDLKFYASIRNVNDCPAFQSQLNQVAECCSSLSLNLNITSAKLSHIIKSNTH